MYENHDEYGIIIVFEECSVVRELSIEDGKEQMLLSTTSNVEGRKIKEYRGVVFGEVVNGIDFTKDFMANITNFTGGRSEEYEQEIIDARADALTEMSQRAEKIGANAIIGVKVDYEPMSVGEDGVGMLMVTASGTAVVLE